jgi:hypothetical protein
MLMGMVSDAIDEEAKRLAEPEEEAGYHPVDRPLFGGHRRG